MDAVMKQYTIYKDPDAPLETRYSVREWAIGPGVVDKGPLVAEHVSLKEARDAVPEQNDTCMTRAANDAPEIVETWI